MKTFKYSLVTHTDSKGIVYYKNEKEITRKPEEAFGFDTEKEALYADFNYFRKLLKKEKGVGVIRLINKPKRNRKGEWK